jgi:acyl-CoA synthetase (AMP-forming)/AMP-acid ligase II
MAPTTASTAFCGGQLRSTTSERQLDIRVIMKAKSVAVSTVQPGAKPGSTAILRMTAARSDRNASTRSAQAAAASLSRAAAASMAAEASSICGRYPNHASIDPVTGAELGPGEPGELLSRGPARCQGYDHLPEATAEQLTDDGWLRTGDIVEIDETGLVRVKGRIKDLIKVHAGQVSPVEIESLLLEHPAIADAAVFGRPNAHAGEIPVAYVVWRQEIDPFVVMEWVNDRLLPYKRLRAIETTGAIPRNPQGKTLRRILAAEDAKYRTPNAA